MSGKSTLLRALGVNALLAYAGAPVCATSMRIGPAVATSMRIEDSLEQGVSHFYAELRRLKPCSTSRSGGQAAGALPLDEILHGYELPGARHRRLRGRPRSRRPGGARRGLDARSGHHCAGGELGGIVQNVHFEEQVSGETMTFDYVLRPGIVQSSTRSG